ncbi:MAG: Fe-S protein assembly co-chaperone HscB [Gammaproteobacteria bacterium]
MKITSNYFELLGMPVSFEIELDTLYAHFKALQNSVHPDKYAKATDEERRISMQYAAQVNQAYQTLKEPLARAQYLLELNNVESNADQSHHNSEFLAEQIEIREQLSDVRVCIDALPEVNTLRNSINSKIESRIKQLAKDLRDRNEASLVHAAELVQELQFFYRLSEEIDMLEEKCFN